MLVASVIKPEENSRKSNVRVQPGARISNSQHVDIGAADAIQYGNIFWKKNEQSFWTLKWCQSVFWNFEFLQNPALYAYTFTLLICLLPPLHRMKINFQQISKFTDTFFEKSKNLGPLRESNLGKRGYYCLLAYFSDTCG